MIGEKEKKEFGEYHPRIMFKVYQGLLTIPDE
jgi:hypothetical protein